MQTLSLNGTWELVERPLSDGADAYAAVETAPATLAANVPGDVNDDLFRAGKLPDPLVALNFRDYAAWVPARSWWYRRAFRLPKGADAAHAELRLDGLDVHADIWLNGTPLGHHATSFVPFAADVSKLLRAKGDNLLVVRLTTGRERVAHLTAADFPLLDAVPSEAPRGYPDRAFPQRIFLRKPAYSWGWDWSPALPTCGITGDCALVLHAVNEIERVTLDATLGKTGADIRIGAELRRRTTAATAWGTLRVRLTDEDGAVHETAVDNLLVRSGLTLATLTLHIPRPRLWWPNGTGAQHRYLVEATLACDDGTAFALEPFRWGLRTVALDTAPGRFRFLVNGEPVFIQGGNWVPCDHLCGRTTDARLEHLVAEAAYAHFNCLRVWGGGRYERDAFFDACDRHGILLWHDFMSACAPLPYDDAAFAGLCHAEAVYQMRRLRNHPSLLLWCGNNEVSAAAGWGNPLFDTHPDPAWAFYFRELPRIAAAELPSVPYWPTSPYGGANVDDLAVGDDHHWVVMRPDPAFWSDPDYWDRPDTSIFNSEYGYGGPCSLATTRHYLGLATDAPVDLASPVAREHTNTFYDIPRVNFSIETHYRAAADLPVADYIRLGGLCQGLNLGHSLESLRANRHTWGGIFWMYNDAWCENGWTIIDAMLRRKISFYNVRRCLAPVRLVLRPGGLGHGGKRGEVLLIGLNATRRKIPLRLNLGYMRYDGAAAELEKLRATLPPTGGKGIVLATLKKPTAAKLRHGTLVALPANAGTEASVDTATWRHARWRELDLPAAAPRITHTGTDGDDLLLTVTTDAYAHAVSFDIPDDIRLDDCWFDLLPGQTRTIRLHAAAHLATQPLRVRCVNEAATCR